MPSVGEALTEARASLKQALALNDREAGLEAHVLLGHALEASRAWLIAHADADITQAGLAAFHALLGRRLRGEPVAHLLGTREFFGVDLAVTPDVLIPRPETELLVELALAIVPIEEKSRILDLGTGSGAVAIALARHRPASRITAIDQSAAALGVARDNARRLEAHNIRFLQGDWLTPLDAGEDFDVIVGNPPYIAEGDAHLNRGDLRFEPRIALVAGTDGLDAIRAILEAAPRHLRSGGRLLLEHGFDQGSACRRLFAERGFRDVVSHVDLAGHARVTGGEWPATSH